MCDVSVASCKDSLVMTEPSGWMELDQAPVFTKDGRQFAMVRLLGNPDQVAK